MNIELLTKPVKSDETEDTGTQALGRILLVEDHDVNQILIKAMIERLGYTSELAIDGANAVEKIDASYAEEHPYDCVLMDVQMPIMDGYEATRMIRASGIEADNLPIIAITANAFSEDIEACHAAGMQAHIAKPVMIGALKSTLQYWTQGSVKLALQSDEPVEPASLMNGELAQRYKLRKQEALHCLTSLVRLGTYSEKELTEVSDHLHKLAGTAAIFGDDELGIRAKLIENGLNQWSVQDRPINIKRAVSGFLKAA